MGEIVNFGEGAGPERKDDEQRPDESLAALVWSCGRCGNTTFQLVEGGACRCACCNQVSAVRAHFAVDEAR